MPSVATPTTNNPVFNFGTNIRTAAADSDDSESNKNIDDDTLGFRKKLAIQMGIKVPGKGWAKCCPPDGNTEAISQAIKRRQRLMTQLDPPLMTQLDPPNDPDSGISLLSGDSLKSLAVGLGIKKDQVGWPTCCPPSGKKEDIRRAIVTHQRELQKGTKHSWYGF